MIKLHSGDVKFPDLVPHIDRVKSTIKKAGSTKVGDWIVRRNTDYIAQAGMQELFGTIEADVIFAGGQPGGGKSFGLMIEAARGIGSKGYNAIIVKKELVSTKSGGGSIVDFAKQMYMDWGGCSFTSAENPTFQWNDPLCSIQFTHANFEGNTEKSIKDAQEKMKNKQASFIGIDELTDFPFTTFNYFFTRNRDDSGIKPKMICTFNTNGWHFTRTMIDWYIDEDNYVIPERLGKIRYFVLNGDTENDFVWGNTKAEVLAQVDIDVPEDMQRFGITKESMVKSFTFIPCKMMDNELLMHSTGGAHAANVFNAGAAEQKKLFYGYWGETERGSYQLTDDDILAQFTTAGEGDDVTMYITADIGDGGDPSLAIVWRGMTKIARELNYTDDPKEKIAWFRELMEKYKVIPQHVAFDGSTIGNYIDGFLLDTIPIISNVSPLPTYDTAGNKNIVTNYVYLIDQLMDRLVAMHKSRRIKSAIDGEMLVKYGVKREYMRYKDILCTEKALFVRYETESGKVHYESKKIFKKKYKYSPDDTDCEKYRMIWELNTKERKEVEQECELADFAYLYEDEDSEMWDIN